MGEGDISFPTKRCTEWYKISSSHEFLQRIHFNQPSWDRGSFMNTHLQISLSLSDEGIIHREVAAHINAAPPLESCDRQISDHLKFEDLLVCWDLLLYTAPSTYRQQGKSSEDLPLWKTTFFCCILQISLHCSIMSTMRISEGATVLHQLLARWGNCDSDGLNMFWGS